MPLRCLPLVIEFWLVEITGGAGVVRTPSRILLSFDAFLSLRVQILTGEQMAQCLVAGYPWWPDTLAIATCVAAEVGEDGAAAALQTHFSRMGLS